MRPLQRRRPWCRSAFAALLCACACSAPGGLRQDHRTQILDRDPLQSARSVLALDFGTWHGGRRLDNLRSAREALSGELARGRRLRRASTALTSESRRLADIPTELGTAVRAEAMRRPTRTPTSLLPTRRAFARHVADDLWLAGSLLGPGRHALAEIDDHQHRTHVADDRPEKTLWQRLWRRLRP